MNAQLKWFLGFFTIILAVYAATNSQVDNANPLDLNDYELIMGSGSDINPGDNITALTLNQKFNAIKTKVDDIEQNLLTEIANLEAQLAQQPAVIDCTDPVNIDNSNCTSIPNPTPLTSCDQLSTTEDFNGNSVATYQESSCYINGDTASLGGCFISEDELSCLDSCNGTFNDKKCDAPTTPIIDLANFYIVGLVQMNTYYSDYHPLSIPAKPVISNPQDRDTRLQTNATPLQQDLTVSSIIYDAFGGVIFYPWNNNCLIFLERRSSSFMENIFITNTTNQSDRIIDESTCRGIAESLGTTNETVGTYFGNTAIYFY